MLKTRFYAQKRVDDKWDIYKEEELSKSCVGIGSFQITTGGHTRATSIEQGISSKEETLKKLSELEQTSIDELPERVRTDVMKSKLPKNHYTKG